MAGPSRRGAVLLLPVALVALGLLARAAAARAFTAFTDYRPAFVFVPSAAAPSAALTPQVVVVLLDGLGLAASRGLPFLDELRARGASFDCHAGVPSLSLPARAVLMTGAWQEVHGQTTNYHARPLRLDHLFRLAHAKGALTALAAGEDTHTLFAPHVVHRAVHAEEPETALFAQSEAALRRHVAAAAALMMEQPGFAVLELTLADDAGHGWGSRSPEYARAAVLVDAAARELAALVDLDRATLVVTADHGHIATGGHGGPEPEAIAVPLVLAGRGVRRGARGTCAQVDVAPTLAVLLGLPLPAASQGRPLIDALELTAAERQQALCNAVAQRDAFLTSYTRVLQPPAPGDVTPAALAAAGTPPRDDEEALRRRLDSLGAAVNDVKERRLRAEAAGRALPALLLAALPFALLLALGRWRAFPPREALWASAFALAGVAAYHLLLPRVGLGYSLSIVNKDEWLQRFFLKDMALGLLACVVMALALCLWRRRNGASLPELCRLAWLCAAAFCAVFVIKVAFVYWRHDVFPKWAMPEQGWGFAFYLDVLVLMAVGLCAPALPLVAALARLVPARA